MRYLPRKERNLHKEFQYESECWFESMKEILNILLEEHKWGWLSFVVFNGVFLELFSLKGFSK